MSARPLTSTYLNYLIWRYLQESGHGEAAVKLQRDWNPDPQSLTIAPLIKTHALVSLVQKGLQYHEIENSISSQARHSSLNGDRNLPSASSTYLFGPESDRAMRSPNEEDMDEDDGDNVVPASAASPRSRKHGRESGSNGVLMDIATQAPAPKRHRKSNGVVEARSNGEGIDYGNGNGNRNGNGDPMETDRNGYTHPHSPTAAESPAGAAGVEPADDDDAQTPAHAQVPAQAQAEAEAEAEARTKTTLTNGASVGVQSEKVAELGPQTTILDLRDVNDSDEVGIINADLDRSQSANGDGSGNRTRGGGQSVMHTTWHPKEPTVLATAGEALARIWTISRSDNPTTRQYVDLLGRTDRSLVTAISWSPDGEFLAVASRHLVSNWIGQVTIWTKDGVMRDELPAAHDMMLALRWNPPGSRLLGVASSGNTSCILVWDPSTGQALQPVELEDTVLDAAWTGDVQYTVCGQGIVINFIINHDHTTSAGHQYPHHELRQNWSVIRWDSVSQITALAAEENASLAITYPLYDVQTTTAHSGALTSLLFQPHPNPSIYSTSETRLLATASVDGTIKLWDATRPFTMLHKLSLGPETPAMALSFTPDGYLVAAASYNKILIYRAEEGGLPKACWIGEKGRWIDGAGAVTRVEKKEEGEDERLEEVEEEEERSQDHSLSWDADGGKLAFGLRSQIAIINFRR